MMDLFVFSVDESWIEACDAGGANGFIVDWERVGKQSRQLGFDTQISSNTTSDLGRVRRWTTKKILVRVDRCDSGILRNRHFELAAAMGADEVLLPMVRDALEVERALEQTTALGLGCGVLIETQSAVRQVKEICRLPITRVYVGLNDLAIDRGTGRLFAPLADGTIDDLRPLITRPFGIAGATVPTGGHPVPARQMMAALVGLRCNFTFLRRSFHADVGSASAAGDAIRLIRQTMALLEEDPLFRQTEQRNFVESIGRLPPDIRHCPAAV